MGCGEAAKPEPSATAGRRSARAARHGGGSWGVVPPGQEQRADPLGQAEQADHLVVEHVGGDRAIGYRRRELPAPRPVRARHRQVEGCQGGAGRAARRVPVRRDHAVEAPLALEHVPQQARVLGHRDPVDLVVGGHHQRHPGFAHARLERGQVQLAEHRLGDPCVVGPALGLRVVADEVLGCRGDSGALDAADERDSEHGGQHRVLGEALEPAAAEWRAHQVDRGSEQHVDALAPRLCAQGGGQLADQVGIPGGPERGRAGQAGRRLALVKDHPPDPGRAVRHDHRPEPERFGALRAPAVGAGQQQRLFVHGEIGQEMCQAFGRLGPRPAGSPAGRGPPRVVSCHRGCSGDRLEVQDGLLEVRRVR